MRRLSLFTCFFAAATLAAAPAVAAEIKVLTAGAFRPVVNAVTAEFEARSGHKLVVVNDTAGGLVKRIGAGEAFDVLIATPAVLKQMVSDAKVVAGTTADLARVGVGVAVKDGAARPDVATVEGFKAALTAARKVAYIDPAAGGSSGIYFTGLLDRLGLADIVKAKAVLVPGGLVAQRLVNDEADLAVHQISEILAVKGATLVGPLPAEIQNYTVYSVGLGSGAVQPDAARGLIGILGGDATRRVLAEKGMEPARP